ncbi:hypothetical protein [Mesorhizobium hawassense]|uniref:hypothetical protein n=1 Tax=Mesorhizobium hawassense TaxID=1209954 RepID=UPI001ABEFFC7|nr:hypothetical protein [Mesorhizobium hawassense]
MEKIDLIGERQGPQPFEFQTRGPRIVVDEGNDSSHVFDPIGNGETLDFLLCTLA